MKKTATRFSCVSFPIDSDSQLVCLRDVPTCHHEPEEHCGVLHETDKISKDGEPIHVVFDSPHFSVGKGVSCWVIRVPAEIEKCAGVLSNKQKEILDILCEDDYLCISGKVDMERVVTKYESGIKDFSSLPAHLCLNKKIVLGFLERGYDIYPELSESMKQDRDICAAAFSMCGNHLSYAPQKVTCDKELCEIAIDNDFHAYADVSLELQADKSLFQRSVDSASKKGGRAWFIVLTETHTKAVEQLAENAPKTQENMLIDESTDPKRVANLSGLPLLSSKQKSYSTVYSKTSEKIKFGAVKFDDDTMSVVVAEMPEALRGAHFTVAIKISEHGNVNAHFGFTYARCSWNGFGILTGLVSRFFKDEMTHVNVEKEMLQWKEISNALVIKGRTEKTIKVIVNGVEQEIECQFKECENCMYPKYYMID